MIDIEDFKNEDPLLRQMNDALVVHGNKEKPRDYIGASAIGGACMRREWYKLQGHREVFDADTLRRFQDGHDTEAKIISWLEMLPHLELHTESMGKQYGFSDLDDKFKGHYDGVIRGIPQAPKTWHILEIKATKQQLFNKLKKLITKVGEKNALEEWNEQYYAQAMLYCHYEGITRHLTIVSTPGGRELLTLRTNANPTYAKALRGKAQRLLGATSPPQKIGGPDWYQCKWCNFYDMCQGNKDEA